MRAQNSQLGSVLLQVIVIILVAASALVFFRSWRSSTEVDRNESQAIRVLELLHAAEAEVYSESSRFEPLLPLLSFESNFAATEKRQALKHEIRSALIQGEVFVNQGYCFLVLMVDRSGLETASTKTDLNPDFFIAYAWPEKFGETGRRVFVTDQSGAVRAWENRLPADFSYSGPEEAPPGHLAPPPEGFPDYPFSLKRQGPQKTLTWHLIAGSGRP